MEIFRLFGSVFIKDEEARKSLNDIEKEAKTKSGSISGVLKNAFSFAGGMAIFETIKTGFKESIGAGWAFNDQMQQSTAAFETMLGSSEAAGGMLENLQKFASTTPFELTDLAKGSQTLLAFGANSDSIMPTLKMLGDVSMGNKDKFNSLTLAFGQVQSAGKLTGQDLLQMIGQGFNPLQIISEKTGKSMSTLKEEMSAGAITSDMVTQAFKDATSEGGLFAGAMDKQSKTFSGLMSTLKDGVQMTFGKILQPAFDGMTNTVLPAIIDKVSKFQESFQSSGSIIQAVMATMGIDVGSASDLLHSKLSNVIDRFKNLYQQVLPSFNRIVDSITQRVIPNVMKIFNSLVNDILPIVINTFMNITEKVVPPFMKVFEFIYTEIIPKVYEAFAEYMPTIQAIIEGLRDVIMIIVDNIVSKFEFAWPYIAQVISIVTDTITGIVGGLLKVLQGIIDFVVGAFTGDWQRAWSGIESIFSGIWDVITSTLKGAINYIISAINSVINGFNNIQISVPAVDIPLVGVVGGFSIGLPSIPNIPMLAEGGTVTQKGFALVGEKAPELLELDAGARVTPLDKMQNNNNKEVNVHVYLSGKAIISALRQPLADDIRIYAGLRGI